LSWLFGRIFGEGTERSSFKASSSSSAATCSSSSDSVPESIRCPDRFGTEGGGWSSSVWVVVATAGVVAWAEAETGTGRSSSKSSLKSCLAESDRWIASRSFDEALSSGRQFRGCLHLLL
jgi:hypothetical protein